MLQLPSEYNEYSFRIQNRIPHILLSIHVNHINGLLTYLI